MAVAEAEQKLAANPERYHQGEPSAMLHAMVQKQKADARAACDKQEASRKAYAATYGGK